MAEPFSHHYRSQWRDIDFNQHMANSSYLAYAEQTRMLFLDSQGFTMAKFAQMQIGPVVLEDRLVYKREIRMLETFTVDVQLAAATLDLRRMRVRNRFVTEPEELLDEPGELAAVVDSVVLWFDLLERTPTTPPEALRNAWLTLERADDFEEWD